MSRALWTTMRSSYDSGRYVGGEADVIYGTVNTWNRTQPQAVVYCHGSMATAATVSADAIQSLLLEEMAEDATVHVGDLGFETFGNDTVITRIGQAVTHLATEWGQEGPIVLVGASMGALGALSYTLAHPENVTAVAGIIPGLDIADLATRGFSAAINTAYGGTYDNATEGPAHSPVMFASKLPHIPIHFWTASNDTSCVPATADAFIAARPQTGRTDLGAVGHTPAAITAATAGVVEFVRQYTNP